MKWTGLFAAFALITVSGLAWSASSDQLEKQLARNFQTRSPVYIGYERVGPQNTSHDHQQYLVLDFRFLNKPDNQRLQKTVAQICDHILHNHSLLRQLDHRGYDEISVAFNRQYQYDCL